MSKSDLRALRVSSESDLDGLSADDLRWLAERDRIPTGLKEDLISDGRLDFSDLANETVPASQRGNTGDVRNVSTDDLERELERRRAAEEPNPNREQPDPHFDDLDADDVADDGDDDDDDAPAPKKVKAKKQAKKAAASSDDDEDD